MDNSSKSQTRGIKNDIIKLYKNGLNYIEIKTQLNCSKGTISYHLTKFIKEEKELLKISKNKLIDKIKNNPPLTKEEFNKNYSKLLTSREIRFFYGLFYKKPNMGSGGIKTPKEYYQKKRILVKNELVEYKGGKCEICEYDKCNKALEFHHLNPKEKDFSISNHSLKDINKLKKEVDKCILVCSNCHREIHDNLHNL
jgi:hypothetical protein